MKLVYVAGPLFAPNDWEIRRHIHRAASLGYEVAKLGAYPVIPHTNTGSVFMGTMTPEFWYEGTLELMRACHAVILVPGWEESKGTRGELVEAKRLEMPVFYDPGDLKVWLGDSPVFDRAVRLLGPGAIVGRNEQYGAAPFHVGAKDRNMWTHFGAGATYEEAFANVKKVKLQKADQSFVYEEGEKTNGNEAG